MTRTEARELLMQLFFQMELQGDYSDEIKDKYLYDHFQKNSQRQYAQKLCDAVLTNLDAIDSRINENSPNWSTGRMAKVDLAITRLATAELFYMDDIPDAVAINEAVDMAKKYSAEESKKFVNGVLGQVVKKKDE